jgi:hypothetical protein
MSTDGNEPAYPDRNNSGLTKREYFAAMALKGILSNAEEMPREKGAMEDEDEMEGEEGEESYGEGDNYRRDGESCTECACRIAVEHADELIRALNK